MGFDAKTVQTMLTQLRYYRGPINGDLRNDVFRDALKKFQADKKLSVDGVYGNECEKILTKFADAQAAGVKLEDLRVFRITNYYIAEESEYNTGTVPFPDANFKTLAKGSPEFFCDASLEGTGKLRDGRLLNVAGAKAAPASKAWDSVLATSARKFPGHIPYGGVVPTADGAGVAKVMTWNEVPADRVGVGYGTGKKGVPYTPFKTVASDVGAYGTSDPRYKGLGGLVPAGTKIFMPEMVGVRLPDGTVHDGWIIANDTGGAIFGVHLDFFTGTRTLNKGVYRPNFSHLWFDGITSRIKPDYTWGLTTV